MNIQDNAQKKSDYYKELKTVRKEIDKIYKQLTKNETLPEMIQNIKNDLSKNITFILTNISKPKSTYTDDTKIIKILDVLITLLKKCTFYDIKHDALINNIKLDIKLNDTVNKNTIDTEISIVLDEKEKNIIKLICIITYYKKWFESENYTNDEDAKIDALENELKIIDKKEVEKIKDKNKEIETYKRSIVIDKYKNLFQYIQIASFDIFEYVDKRYTDLTAKDKDAKDKDAKEFIETFKTEVYYALININNNSSGVDSESQLYENGNEKVELEARKDLLVKLKEQLDKQLKQLNDIRQFLIDSDKQEYSKEITELKNAFKDYKKEKEYDDNILTILVNEEGEVKNQLEKNSMNKKILADKAEQDRMRLQRDLDIAKKTGGRNRQMKIYGGGEQKTSKYYEEKYKPLNVLLTAIDQLIKKIAEIEGKDDDDKDPFSKKNGMFGDTDNDFNSIYNNIWKDYKKEMNKIKSKGVTLDSLKQDNRLYERVKENNLDPQDVLKITFQDKVIFICIILIIRTFAMVLIELLIEYNIVSTLNRGIFVYSIIYLLLLLTGVLIINYDSYKLRILVNYLNIHINSSNIFFHALLFCLFIGLIFIIINDEDNSLKSIDNIFNYTYVYKYIYEIAEKSNPMSHLLLSQKEKLKLQYRMDIITMIIFIFSSLLILIM
jgi:hypothetical protein